MFFWVAPCLSAIQFDVSCRLAEGTLYPIVQIINEDAKQDWTLY